MLSHSPLRMFTQFHKMRVLVLGQGPVEEVAHKYPVLSQGLLFWRLTLKACMFCLFSVFLFMFHFVISV